MRVVDGAKLHIRGGKRSADVASGWGWLSTALWWRECAVLISIMETGRHRMVAEARRDGSLHAEGVGDGGRRSNGHAIGVAHAALCDPGALRRRRAGPQFLCIFVVDAFASCRISLAPCVARLQASWRAISGLFI